MNKKNELYLFVGLSDVPGKEAQFPLALATRINGLHEVFQLRELRRREMVGQRQVQGLRRRLHLDVYTTKHDEIG